MLYIKIRLKLTVELLRRAMIGIQLNDLLVTDGQTGPPTFEFNFRRQ